RCRRRAPTRALASGAGAFRLRPFCAAWSAATPPALVGARDTRAPRLPSRRKPNRISNLDCHLKTQGLSLFFGMPFSTDRSLLYKRRVRFWTPAFENHLEQPP